MRVSLDRNPRRVSHTHQPEPEALDPAPARSVFGEWLALQIRPADGAHFSRMPLTCTEPVTRALRGALLRHAIDPPPAALSGHTPAGRPLERPHAAFVALPDPSAPNPAAPNARAGLAGVAIVLPRGIGDDERRAILLAAARWEQGGLRLVLGRLGALRLARAEAPAAGDPLDPAPWLGPSRRWATVTPIALEKNPGKLTSADPAVAARAAGRAEDIVAHGCAHVGLPRPAGVRVLRRSLFSGIPSAPEFGAFPQGAARPGSGKFRRVCVHAELEFAAPVEGPVLLGAGRYFGVGLCRVCKE